MAVADQAKTQKKRRPPTFQHLPKNRAAKLKKIWVEKKKLRSQWRAQKRKEELGVGRRRTPHLQDSATGEMGSEEPDSVADSSAEDHEERREPVRKKERTTAPPVPSKSPVPKQRRSSLSGSAKPHSSAHAPPSPAGEDEDGAEPEPPRPSLRELTRQAYSRASLHTFKADPLHRRKGAIIPGSGAGSDTRGARGRRGRSGPARGGRGAVRDAHGGRGQPNMKLRMEAMLERIKRDQT